MITVFLPFRGEFGHLLMWHAPVVNAHEEAKIVCCERGQEALFIDVLEYYFVDPRPEDKRKTANAHKYDKDLFNKIKKQMKKRFPDAQFVSPVGEFNKTAEKKYIAYQPYKKQGIECDIVVCPRKRELAPDRNWKYWPKLTKKLMDAGFSVFAVGSPKASFDVPCKKAWEYERFFDATLEAIQSCKFVVCTDSGLAHLAVQCGKPVIMITYKGQPGPGTRWKVKWKRYKVENHLNVPLLDLAEWEDLDKVLKMIIKRANEEKIERKGMSEFYLDPVIFHPKDPSPKRNRNIYPKIYKIKYEICKEVKPKKIAEIGVRAGYSAWAFLQAVPEAEYVGFDANNGKHGGQGGADGKWKKWAKKLLAPYNARFVEVNTQQVNSLDVEGIDFFHVDGDHTEKGVQHDLDLAYAVMSDNGVILVDDITYIPEVKRGVDIWISKMGDKISTEFRESPRGEQIIRKVN